MAAISTLPADPFSKDRERRSGRSELIVALAVIAIITALRVLFIASSHLELDFEEAQYWYWAQQPAWGYFSKPPLIAWLIGATTWLFGDSEGAVRLASPLLHGAIALTILGIGRHTGDSRLGAWSAIAYATMPGTSLSATLITTDVPLLFFWATALYCLLRRRDGGGPIWSLVCGLAIGGGMLAKYAMAYFLPCTLIYLMLDAAARRHFRAGDALIALAATAACLAPNLAWNLAHGFATLRHTADNADLGGVALDLREIANFLGSQFGLMGPVLFSLLVAGSFMKTAPDGVPGNHRFLVCFSLPIFVVILGEAVLSRAHANWAAPAFASGIILAVETGFRLRRGWRWLLPAAIAGHAAIGAVLCAALVLVPTFSLPGGRIVEVGARFSGWAELGRTVAAALRSEPGTTLLGEQRSLLAYLTYYARPVPGVIEWTYVGVIDDQFKLSAHLDPGAPGPFLLVASNPTPAALGHFDSQGPAIEVTIRPAAGIERHFWMFRLRGFRGY